MYKSVGLIGGLATWLKLIASKPIGESSMVSGQV
jgi:hypothetical protein